MITQTNGRFIFALTFAAALGTGLNAGVFFVFSSFVMPALARLPAAQGIAAMQSINVAVINLSFAVVLFGTALVSLVLIVLALQRRQRPGAGYQIAGGLLYLIVTMLVTFAFNVPLNNALDKVVPTSAEGAHFWDEFLSRWIAWNHVRTVGALAAAASFTVAVFRLGEGEK